MRGFTDIHSHFLYGVDDGAKTRRDMEAMLDAAHAEGISTLFATPHITPGVAPFDVRLFAERLDEARLYCHQRDYKLTLYGGAEVLCTPAIGRMARDRTLPPLANSSFLLLEFVPDATREEIEGGIDEVERGGYVPVLAHIERYSRLDPDTARRFKEAHDVRYQINCGCLLKKRGFFADRRLKRLLDEQLIDFMASDAHNCDKRPFLMRNAYEVLAARVGARYAAKLTGLA